MEVSIEVIIRELKKHGVTKEKIDEVYEAYDIAEKIHRDQPPRETGEPYISHPLNVALNVLRMGVFDPDTVSAALLHDTVEDASFKFTVDDIAEMINPTVAELVDGVTKMKAMDFSSKSDQIKANTKKIVNGLTKDVRIIIIKLADRLHNMNTMEKKNPKKQKENAEETLKIFALLALAIGAYRVKNELEELSLKYIDRESYERIKKRREELFLEDAPGLEEMSNQIKSKLNEIGIDCKTILRTQSLYTIYKKEKRGYDMENQYDLNYLKIVVDTIDDCYRALGVVHRCYKPINGRLKDYICNPRTNNYQSIHTTVADKNGKFIKVKIRTREMDKIDAYGVAAYWNIENYDNIADIEYGKTIEETNEIIREKSQFAKKLMEINEVSHDDNEFVSLIMSVLLTDHIYVYTDSGQCIELPDGSTAMNFLYEVFPDKLDDITGIIVNGKEVSPKEPLKNNDRIQIKIDGKITHEGWKNYTTEETLKQKIKRLNERNNAE